MGPDIARRLRFGVAVFLAGLASFYAGTHWAGTRPAPPRHPITGRQIAGIATDADWMDRASRDSEEQPDLALDLLDLKAGMLVADIGAGSGYMTLRIASRIGPTGRVFATDIQANLLQRIDEKARAAHFTNVTIVQGREDDAGLPDEAVELALLVDVYHELSRPQQILQSIHRALKPEGRLVLIEYRKEMADLPIALTHRMSVAETRTEVEAEGFRYERSLEDLPRQHVIVFRR